MCERVCARERYGYSDNLLPQDFRSANGLVPERVRDRASECERERERERETDRQRQK